MKPVKTTQERIKKIIQGITLFDQTSLVIFLCFCVGVFSLGSLFGSYKTKFEYQDFLKGFKTIRENSNQYSYINPLIGNISDEATKVGIFVGIKKDIIHYLQKEQQEGNLASYSFYFRDLDSGLWFGGNAEESFFPASLFKLPLAIAAYKQAEDDSAFSKRRFIYTNALDAMNNSAKENSPSVLHIGESYSLEDLIRAMLVGSDNGAKNLLLSSLDERYLNALFDIVSVVEPNKTQKYEISAPKYSLFLRILYGSSYLNNEHSEFLMKLLTESDFHDGLVAGAPSFVRVAHKFGTYEVIDNGTTLTLLHDCGVVYADKPYVLCIMTKGRDLTSLYRIIANTSSLVYRFQTESD